MHLTVAVSSAVVALISLARLVVRHPERESDAWHAVMAAGMVAMALPAADPLPGWGWAACFGAGTVWAAVVLVRIGPVHAAATDLVTWRGTAATASHQLAGGLAMLLMLALGHADAPVVTAGSTVGSTAGHHGGAALVGDVSAVAVVAGAAFLVVAAVGVARLVRASVGAGDGGAGPVDACTRRGGDEGLLASPAIAAGRSAVMAAAMGAMLLTIH